MTRIAGSVRRRWLLPNHAVVGEEERTYLRRGMNGGANRSSHTCMLAFNKCLLSFYYAPSTGLGATVQWGRIILFEQSINKPSQQRTGAGALFQVHSTLWKLPEPDHSQLYQPGISQENKAAVTIPRIKGFIRNYALQRCWKSRGRKSREWPWKIEGTEAGNSGKVVKTSATYSNNVSDSHMLAEKLLCLSCLPPSLAATANRESRLYLLFCCPIFTKLSLKGKFYPE